MQQIKKKLNLQVFHITYSQREKNKQIKMEIINTVKNSFSDISSKDFCTPTLLYLDFLILRNLHSFWKHICFVFSSWSFFEYFLHAEMAPVLYLSRVL